MTFDHIELTGLTEQEILSRAEQGLIEMEERFGKGVTTLQNEIDGYIDAAIEHNQ